ncbi:peptidyl-prolyl cis-trans isomerase, cyclophilin-type [Microscilla marina ATCC 23134]|uniref:Peptidyl-prolyl cis-trans isomerase n=2 Tax=Microscilla marina TaxID=1027 RepID=A1ZG67_MICM2|nr:peptidyl-prolyl cis-trans isomerase, cyclophilin-type [Microscilla marina ATCC 23134]
MTAYFILYNLPQKLIDSRKMKKKYFFIQVVLLILLSFGSLKLQAQSRKSSKDYLVQITTSFGNMYLVLYDDTPKHKNNFIKLVKKKFYKDLLFHRIIKGFMIQGGDPDSRNAPKGKMLGMGGSDMAKIEAEFRSEHIHKKGALAAARDGNPKKASNACQFYIVHGRPVTGKELNAIELRKGIKYTPKQREAYTTLGGFPPLDQNYTVFGEVVKGFEVIDKIAQQEKDRANRPYKDIKMDIKVRKMRKKKITRKFGYKYNQ